MEVKNANGKRDLSVRDINSVAEENGENKIRSL